MATYSPSLKITLLADGEQSGTWGQTQNNNLGTLLEQAITGVVSISMADANYTLSNLNGTSDEARNSVLVVSGTNNGVRDIIAPLANKLYTVYNLTTNGYAIRIRGSSGSAVTISNGVTALVYCDGINFYSGLSGVVGDFSVNGAISTLGNATIGGNLSASGNVTATGGMTATGNVTSNSNVVAVTAFVGPGTGLTGTGTSFTAGNATVAASAVQLGTTNFTVAEVGGKLVIQYSGATVVSIDSTGILTSASDITGGGTP